MKFTKNTKYYDGIVYEFNLPVGHTCPYAVECLVHVNKETGKFTNESKEFRCYAASAERFPGVRNSRWNNFEYVKNGGIITLDSKMKSIRIHSSGDFFSQSYFDMWLDVCNENPNVEFWAYTKSLNFWIKRINEIPNNLTLTASRGGKFDELIDKYNLKNVKVINPNLATFISKEKCIYNGVEYYIDYTDNIARDKNIKDFVLLDNNIKLKIDNINN